MKTATVREFTVPISKSIKHTILATIACTAALTALLTGAPEAPSETAVARDARMEWWREARLGMFVHWGLYSGLAGDWNGKMVGNSGGLEWIQQRVGADTQAYAAQALPKFVPKPGFATAWAKLAKQAGCQYVVFTTKHHEGFALHDSKLTDYDAGDLLNRDLVREITDALRAEGLRVGFYHSVIDWHHPEYDFRKAKGLPYPKDGAAAGVPPRNHDQYINFLHGQVDELVSNYGQVDVIWWDFSSTGFQGDEAWRATELLAKVRTKQPLVIQNNRLFRIPEAGFSGMGTDSVTNRMDPKYGDFVTPEQHIPPTGLPGVDWETCMTLNTTWGFNRHDHKWKSHETIIRNLIDIASKGGNYLLNIGPTGDGEIPKETVDTFAALGKWMTVNSEAIRGTTASPHGKPSFNGRLTRKGAVTYAHVFKRPDDGRLTVPFKVGTAKMLESGSALKVTAGDKESVIELPATLPDSIATVIRCE